jgi:hypothetical protein
MSQTVHRFLVSKVVCHMDEGLKEGLVSARRGAAAYVGIRVYRKTI